MESLFIKDVMGDQLRNIEGTRMRKEREEALMAGGGMEEIMANQPSALTIADLTMQEKEGDGLDDKDPEHLAAKAVEASRTGNIQEVEFILDLNIIDIDSKDQYGNSLLHLACQQGNKRLVKFLLRRGADIKTQNAAGNSVLHHCHAYSHTDLAEYLLSKGADDSLVNVEGCTCYEGLKKGEVDEI
jgi:ankyrin repeat protein